ncbi:MAG: transcription antitermination factor NusB [Bacteroidales bacterium]|nr:transcription antitermination factor NusB [Bacteroidales bacterium]
MINRALIRLKVVQLIYAYYQNEGKTTEVALNELYYSLDKSYDLYHSLLYLLVELRRMAERREELRVSRQLRSGATPTSASNDGLLATNQFLVQLESNQALAAWAEKQKHTWGQDDVLAKKLYESFLSHEVFLSYVDLQDRSYEADRELVRKLYKTLVVNNEAFDSLLEEQSLYWNDDKEIIDSFVLKSIKRFALENGAEQDLLPQYAAEEDKEFAARLFTTTIERMGELRQYISENTKNWEFSRLAFMDVIIMQIALAEILTFESIPVQVSFNEYLDIAKVYSTPRSSSYINGMLDNIVRRLAADGLVLKPLPVRKPRPQQERPQQERRPRRDGEQRSRTPRSRHPRTDNPSNQ